AVRATGWPKNSGGEYHSHGRWENDQIFDVEVSCEQSRNEIKILVPTAIVGSPTSERPWWCTVIAGANAGGRWRKVVPTEKSDFYIRWMASPEEMLRAGQAYTERVEPRVMDMLVPPGMRQKDLLNGFATTPPSFAKVYAVGPIPHSPYFTVGVEPSSGIVKRGGALQARVEVKSFLGFSGTVTLQARDLPAGLSASFEPSSGRPPFTSTLRLSASETAPTGSSTISIVASGDGLSETCTFKVWTALEYVEISDPAGDDYGPGTYVYPLSSTFRGKPGLFDITRVIYFTDETNYYFAVTFAADRLGGNVWSGEAGFSFQLFEIWVDCKPGGETDPVSKEGCKIRVDSTHAWDFGIQVTGFYKMHKAQRNWIAFPGKPVYTYTIDVSADLAARTVTVRIPKRVVEDNIGPLPPDYPWHAVIISGSQDGFSSNYSWRLVQDSATTWEGGGADPVAFAAGVSPNVYDVVLPEGYDQRKVLKSYSVEESKYAEIPAVPLVARKVEEKGALPVPLLLLAVVVVVVVGVILAKRK
ncbi:MAG: glucodextranase DOMON-like domain-containing protein, partial [Candidatus Hadarchaeales archaeon]